ncbi:hypothetical protein [Spirillospora sp. NPDC029432]|uniref:hypothetical protein n=1 Tax=Spirillospora sp. NPDC029432 TaxID=3154599 RepID=UPI0034563B82
MPDSTPPASRTDGEQQGPPAGQPRDLSSELRDRYDADTVNDVLDDVLRNSGGPWRDTYGRLSTDALLASRLFAQSDHRAINAALDSGDPGALDPYREQVRSHDEVLAGLRPFDGQVVRSAELTPEQIARYREGGVVQEPGFVIASRDPGGPPRGNAEFVIQSRTGRLVGPAIDPRHSEDSVHFPRGTRFEVDRVEDLGDGRTRIHLKEVEAPDRTAGDPSRTPQDTRDGADATRDGADPTRDGTDPTRDADDPARDAADEAPRREEAPVHPRPGLDSLVPRDEAEAAAREAEITEIIEQQMNRRFGPYDSKVTKVEVSDNRVVFRGEVFDGKKKVGEWVRYMERRDGDLCAHHEKLKLDKGYRGKGFSNAFNHHLEGWYRESGVDRITLTAGMSDGGYVWARKGFDFSRASDARTRLRDLRQRTDRLEKWLQDHRDDPSISDEVYNRQADLLEEAEALLRDANTHRFGTAGFPSAQEIAQLGYRPGMTKDDIWLGKSVMEGSGWGGVKKIAGTDPGDTASPGRSDRGEQPGRLRRDPEAAAPPPERAGDPARTDRTDGAGPPHGRPEQDPARTDDGAPSGPVPRRDVPPTLPPHLHNAWQGSARTPGGRAFYGDGGPGTRGPVRPHSDRTFMFDAPGDRNGPVVDGRRLTPADVADLVRADPAWNGRELLLLVNDSGNDPRFTAEVAQRLGVRVQAPTTPVTVDSNGQVRAGGWAAAGPNGPIRTADPAPPAHGPARTDPSAGTRTGAPHAQHRTPQAQHHTPQAQQGAQQGAPQPTPGRPPVQGGVQNLPPSARRLLDQTSAQATGRPFPAGADPRAYLNGLEGEYRSAWALAGMNDGRTMPTAQDLHRIWQNPNLTPEQRGLVHHVLSSPNPEARLRAMSQYSAQWGLLGQALGTRPSVEALNRHVAPQDSGGAPLARSAGDDGTDQHGDGAGDAGSQPPPGLPDHLHDVYRASQETPAGRAFYTTGETAHRDLAGRVPPDPNRFVIDGHGDATGMRVGTRRLSVDDVADLIRNDPDWDGREIMLLSCETGAGDFARELSQRLGVPVTAPNRLAWSDRDGNVYASTGTPDQDNRLQPDHPPNGEWTTFHADGTTTPAGHGGNAPGHPNPQTDLPAPHRADPDLPHQQTDWDPPPVGDQRPARLVLQPGQRIADVADLDPDRVYHVYEPTASGANVLRTIAYTGPADADGHGRVTHVTTPPVDPNQTPPYDPNRVYAPPFNPDHNADFTSPAPGVTHRVDLGIGEPHLFEGDPEDQGRTPSATDFDPPALRHDTVRGYDLDAEGPYSARSDLPKNSRIAVYDSQGRLHGIFWTNDRREVTHVRTWYGNKADGFNPELGVSKPAIEGGDVPRPNARYMVEPVAQFRTLTGADFDPPAGLRSGDMRPDGRNDLRGTFLYETGDRGQTIAATGQPRFRHGLEQRNTYMQGLSGHQGNADYPNRINPNSNRYNGGHIFSYESGGPGEFINYFPQDRFTNQRGSRKGGIPLLTWRAMEEQVRAVDGGRRTRVERFDFFPEPNDPMRTPLVVHARWTQVDLSDPQRPVVTTRYRSYHNLDGAQRRSHGIVLPNPQPGGQPDPGSPALPRPDAGALPRSFDDGHGDGPETGDGVPPRSEGDGVPPRSEGDGETPERPFAPGQDPAAVPPPPQVPPLSPEARNVVSLIGADPALRPLLSPGADMRGMLDHLRLQDFSARRLAALNGGALPRADDLPRLLRDPSLAPADRFLLRELAADPSAGQRLQRMQADAWRLHNLWQALGEAPTPEVLGRRFGEADQALGQPLPGPGQAVRGLDPATAATLRLADGTPLGDRDPRLLVGTTQVEPGYVPTTPVGPGDRGQVPHNYRIRLDLPPGSAGARLGDGLYLPRGTRYEITGAEFRGLDAAGRPIYDLTARVLPSALPPHLHGVFQNSVAIPAGRTLIGTDAPQFASLLTLQPDPDRYILNAHGTRDAMFIGDYNVPQSVDDIAALIRHDPNWNGRDVFLLSCNTGESRFLDRLTGHRPFAALLAERLGVTVTAPDDLAFNDHAGNMYTTSARMRPDGTWDVDHPPRGRWVAFHPDGSRTVVSRGYAPGRAVPQPGPGTNGPVPSRHPVWDPPIRPGQAPVPIRLGPDDRIADRTDLAPNTVYHVVEPGPGGADVLRSIAHTGPPGPGGRAAVTHVATPPGAAGVPIVDPNANIDVIAPRNGVTYRVDLGTGDPQIFRTGQDGGPSPYSPPSPGDGLASGIRSEEPLTEGRDVEELARVTFEDGTTAVRKRFRYPHQADAEALVSAVGEALGVRVPRVHQDGLTVYMDEVGGRSSYEVVDSEARAAWADTPAGRLLGLLDVLVQNPDRSGSNWRPEDGQPDDDAVIYGIDHSDAFHGVAPSPSLNQFTAHYLREDGPARTGYVQGNPLSPEDVRDVRERLEGLRERFVRLDRGDWFDGMMARLDELERNAAGEDRFLTLGPARTDGEDGETRTATDDTHTDDTDDTHTDDTDTDDTEDTGTGDTDRQDEVQQDDQQDGQQDEVQQDGSGGQGGPPPRGPGDPDDGSGLPRQFHDLLQRLFSGSAADAAADQGGGRTSPDMTPRLRSLLRELTANPRLERFLRSDPRVQSYLDRLRGDGFMANRLAELNANHLGRTGFPSIDELAALARRPEIGYINTILLHELLNDPMPERRYRQLLENSRVLGELDAFLGSDRDFAGPLDELNELTERPLGESARVVHDLGGLDFMRLGDGSPLGDRDPHLLVGTAQTQRGIVPTTPADDSAGGGGARSRYRLRLDVPEGSRGAWLDGDLHLGNPQYRVTDVTEVGRDAQNRPIYEITATVIPPTLPDHMRALYGETRPLAHGRMLFRSDESLSEWTPRIQADPRRYMFSVHGNPMLVAYRDTAIGAAELAAMIRHDPQWRGRPITLQSCQTGGQRREGFVDGLIRRLLGRPRPYEPPFAAYLAWELGVPVTAPTQLGWTSSDGDVFTSSQRSSRSDSGPVMPPNGEWVTFFPDGSSVVASQGTLPTFVVWDPPAGLGDPVEIRLGPDERVADRTDLEPNRTYHVVRTGPDGVDVVDAIAHTGTRDANGAVQVTHVGTPPFDPWAPVRDPNDSVDFADPKDGVIYRIDLGVGEPEVFRGGDEARTAAASDADSVQDPAEESDGEGPDDKRSNDEGPDGERSDDEGSDDGESDDGGSDERSDDEGSGDGEADDGGSDDGGSGDRGRNDDDAAGGRGLFHGFRSRQNEPWDQMCGTCGERRVTGDGPCRFGSACPFGSYPYPGEPLPGKNASAGVQEVAGPGPQGGRDLAAEAGPGERSSGYGWYQEPSPGAPPAPESGAPENVPGAADDGVPPDLPAHLEDVYRNSMRTPAGRAFFGADEPMMRDAALAVPSDPDRFVVDYHGGPDGPRAAGRTLSADDMAALIRNDPGWNGREVVLMPRGGDSGEFAAELSRRLGVTVLSSADAELSADAGAAPQAPADSGGQGAGMVFYPGGGAPPGAAGGGPGRPARKAPGRAVPGAEDRQVWGAPDTPPADAGSPASRDGHAHDPVPAPRRPAGSPDRAGYGPSALDRMYGELPPELRNAAWRYAVQAAPEEFFRLGAADPASYLERLARAHRAAGRLAGLNGGRMPASRRELLAIRGRPELPAGSTGLLDGLLTAPGRSLRGLLGMLWKDHLEWERFRGYLGEEPTADAFRRRAAELDRALNRPLPEPLRVVRELPEVSFLVAADGRQLGPRDAVAHLTGTVQTDAAPVLASSSDAVPAGGGVGGTRACRLLLTLPQGSRGLWLGGAGRQEVLLPRGTQYVITRVVPAGAAWTRVQGGRRERRDVHDIEAVAVPPGVPS